MSYLSLKFVLFVIAIFCIYNIYPRKFRWHILLIASLCFYASFDTRYVIFLLFTAITTFCFALLLSKYKRRKWILFLCIFMNVGVLFVIKKYVNMIPIGISYYTLQAIAYLVDVYKQKVACESNFGKYFLFLSYFPAIVQGPISRYNQLSPQLTAGRRVSYDKCRRNLVLILFGLIKKLVVADRIGIFANYCFDNYMDLQGIILYIGAVCYAIQLYTDFSGCVDICRGISAMFGVELIDNFNAPYFAQSNKEFWHRWHISLSTWLRDYVYIPLGGSRKGVVRKYLNLILTFGVSGIWHGTEFHYIVWGMLQSVYQIVGESTYIIRKQFKKVTGVEEGSFSDKLYKVILTFNFTVFAWIFFRASGVMCGIQYIVRMCSSLALWDALNNITYTQGISVWQIAILLLNIFAIIMADYIKRKYKSTIEECVLKTHIGIRWFIYFAMIFDILLFGVYGSGYDMSGFLYGSF